MSESNKNNTKEEYELPPWYEAKLQAEKNQEKIYNSDKCYISIDVETSGPIPGKYSMIALGATVVGNTNKQFYRELKPMNINYVSEAMKIACLGLNCLETYKTNPMCNPKSEHFIPEKALQILYDKGENPYKVFTDFKQWIQEVCRSKSPIEVASPIKFDGMFTSWYFHNFLNVNPLGHSGIDINSLYKGLKKDLNSSIKDLKLRQNNDLTHNALEDALQQAKELEKIIELISK